MRVHRIFAITLCGLGVIAGPASAEQRAGGVSTGSAPGADTPQPESAIVKVADSLSALGSHYPRVFGGITLANRGTQILVHLTDMSASYQASFAAAAGATPVTFVPARTGLATLYEIHERVNSEYKDLSSQMTIFSYGPSVRAGKEEIDVVDLSDADRAILESTFGADNLFIKAVLQEEVDSYFLAGSRIDDAPPWSAGAVIGMKQNQVFTGILCTLGFGIKYPSGGERLLTAGHCSGGETSGWTVRNSDRAGNLGTYVGPVVNNDLWNDPDHPMDAELIDANSSDYAWTGPKGSATKTWLAGTTNNYQGEIVCNDGAFTGEFCDLEVAQVDYCVTIEGFWKCGNVRAETADADVTATDHGDSGGPVISYSRDGAAYAVGIVRGGSSKVLFYTNINKILDFYGASLCHLVTC